MASDSAAILAELERAGWMIIEEHGIHIAVHVDAEDPIKFGGRYGWNLRSIRRQAAEAMGKRTSRPSARRYKITANTLQQKHETARKVYLAAKDADVERERVRSRVIARDNELRDIARLMQPGR